MDLTRKLRYLQSQTAPASDSSKNNAQHQAPLMALKEHFDGRLLYPEQPVLLLEHHKIVDGMPTTLDWYWLSKGEAPQAIPIDKCLFFDLETTGLQGGSGVYAFLAGFAWFRDDVVNCRQYFLPDYGREDRLFHDLNQWFQSFDYLVSYNGKSFDLPVLRSRFLMNRLPLELDNKPHFDLLHMVRRVWKDTLPTCDLQSVERRILGYTRTDDIPGAYIPRAYLDFIQLGRVHDIIRVIEHNQTDLISLPRIASVLHNINRQPHAALNDTDSCMALARSIYPMHDALDFYLLMERNVQVARHPDFLFYKSMLLKRNKRMQQAYDLWQQLFHHPLYSYRAYEETAKYLEHHIKNHKEALQIVDRALDQLAIQKEFGYVRGDLIKKFVHRRNRLLKNLKSGLNNS